ncbi:MAG: tRNA (adenosine(37)-N6)-threonylcarbamoyltransferase complex transferase subunit TsaD [Candidatus Magasanikbacteria bacterium RIFCSPHIGHO2_02_FULL_41_13]|uniref:tRNA N6-adenosine threonylcarbamoyltransferase n=1 Tax=Candidatus Magasanikbacteria bacterium RIFCSPHIGHO2_02_FULL_41_13 TaxID=1798676 RepID=A0A1F6M3V9_9BACT|nr:MAG: tRNA (adenosine(37)-N6)-threonylcarbamoyltransferase complex transferase subunit TsaD [Candidatus Magasanikbacteria bacterium RIFCSPHIGHO2_02_FULL_41_13]
MKPVYILAIDTSCDDTSVAVLKNDRVLSNIVSSQLDIHREWGGVVPNLARREHEKMIDGCVKVAFKRSALKDMKKLTAIAVTYGPGLAPALQVGVTKAKDLAEELKLPLIAVNHMEGHTLSTFLKSKEGKNYAGMKKPKFPFMAVCVSGGHTEIIWVEKIGSYKLIGQTVDDAAGEAFDKVARMLELGYPGGPIISKLAETGDPQRYPLPRPMKDSHDYNFSFSGLKTACLYNTNDLREKLGKKFATIIPDYCASFQEAVVDSLLIKVQKAAKKLGPKMIVIGGGVSANNRLRSKFRASLKDLGIPVYAPSKKMCTDNAAMIAIAAYYKFLRGEIVKDRIHFQRDPSITIETLRSEEK